MQPDTTIYLAGHTGMVGSAIYRALVRSNHPVENIYTRSRAELNLLDQRKVLEFFDQARPNVVIISAAKVGGIHANSTLPYDFLSENVLIQANVINACKTFGVSQICFLGSSCMYPPSAKQPFVEDALLTAAFEPTNEAYALAKCTGLKLCEYLSTQYSIPSFGIIPNNSYGPGDSYDPESSHVIPSIIRKIHQAKLEGRSVVKLWGSGKPIREFIYVDDLADSVVFLLRNPILKKYWSLFNVGSHEPVTIKELAELITLKMDHDCEIFWDASRPDGMLEKRIDTSRINKLGWLPKTSLDFGLSLAVQDYFSRLN